MAGVGAARDCYRTEAATLLMREATRLLTIAFVLRPSGALRLPWRLSTRRDLEPQTASGACAFAQ